MTECDIPERSLVPRCAPGVILFHVAVSPCLPVPTPPPRTINGQRWGRPSSCMAEHGTVAKAS